MKAVPLRDVVSVTIAVDLATVSAILIAGGAIVSAIERLLRTFESKKPEPPVSYDN